jgi:trimethylamine--corrinoid protein Co-methyltransferase
VATPADADAIGFDAIAEVQPGGHFFATTQTMARYRHAFYEPLVADLSNFGTWTEAGSKTATERAQGVWRRIIAEFKPPAAAQGVDEVLAPYIARRSAEGGAAPVS